jgi:hypothetical protein
MITLAALAVLGLHPCMQAQGTARSYVIVGTGQTRCYGDTGPIPSPRAGDAFYGQDAQSPGPRPSYRDNGDGTTSDMNTGLMWVKARGEKVTWRVAMDGAASCRVGGYGDWRVPTIKELYSLINFDGGFHPESRSAPYLDTRYFGFAYGDPEQGERPIDCQDWSATAYLGTTMKGNATVFGVNFADGRIKGYPRDRGPRGVNRLYVRYVRGNPAYGRNAFSDNGNGTVSDHATGLVWSKSDSGQGMDWQAALAWVQRKNAEGYLGHSDWRLPNAKELQSIVDYGSFNPAVDTAFNTTQSGFYWSATTVPRATTWAWLVGFEYGEVNFENKGVNYYVRAVRSGL